MKQIRIWNFGWALLLCWMAGAASAQQRFSDGEITYAVDITLPEGVPAGAADAYQGSQLVYAFKNYRFRSDMHIGNRVYTNIRNSRTNTAVTLIDAGPAKYLIRLNPQQLAEESASTQAEQFTDAGEGGEIAGYACRQAIGKLKDGSTFTVFYTPSIMPENTAYNKRFAGLKGMPLKFEMTTSRGIKMTMTATHVSLAPQPSAKFDAPTSGYREMTYQELQDLRQRS